MKISLPEGYMVCPTDLLPYDAEQPDGSKARVDYVLDHPGRRVICSHAVWHALKKLSPARAQT